MISVTDVSKNYGRRAAVTDLSFEVAAGRVTGFVGPNGAGKSTTMRMMVGLITPDTGQVTYAGVDFRQLRQPATVVGAVLDPRCMHPGRSARQHLGAHAALAGVSADRSEVVLRSVGLESVADQRAGGFSLGMRQRLALAGALLGDPTVLLLDEPSNGLDPEGIRWLREFLRRFADDGGTVFVSSHLIGELSIFADDLVVVGGGKLIVAAPVAEIVGRATSTIVVATPQPGDLLTLLRAHGLSAELVAGRLHVREATRDSVSQLAFEHQIQLLELSEANESLENILLNLTASSTEFKAA